MSVGSNNNSMRCRSVRARFSALTDRDAEGAGPAERSALSSHLDGCVRCAREYQLYSLGRTTLEAAGSSDTITPDREFFVALRARIMRGPIESSAGRGNTDESWAAALLLTARQLLPAMAMLLALIIGATVIWNRSSQSSGEVALRPSEVIVLGDMYEYHPTADDVLETLVSVEDRENGR